VLWLTGAATSMVPRASALFRQVMARRSTRKLLPRSIAFSNSTNNPIETIHSTLMLKTLNHSARVRIAKDASA